MKESFEKINFENKRRVIRYIPAILFLLFPVLTNAHVAQFTTGSVSGFETGWSFTWMGFRHILPDGLDHVLFVLGLFFLNPKIKTALWQATAFTVAHSFTLGLTMAGKIDPPSNITEPLISLSIAIIAIENIFGSKLNWGRIIIVFLFGLVHGCGFASALLEEPIPQGNFLLAIFSFNVGVELGQITVILLAWFLTKQFAGKEWYRRRIVNPVSLAIALIAVFWTIERTFS